jgi:glycosyltransferase involved in cell wall biosynthesis
MQLGWSRLNRLATAKLVHLYMRVLQLGPYPPPHGGVQTHVAALVSFLRERRIVCEVVNLTRFRRPSQDGIFYPSNSLSVLWHLLSHRYQIIHLHIGGRIWLRQLGLALTCCLLPNTRCVLTFHSGGYPSSPEGRSAHSRTLRGFVLRRFDRIIAVNLEIVEFFRRLGIPAERVRMIPPYFAPPSGVDKQDLLPIPLARFIASHHPLLISVGLLEPEYDLSLQMAALGNVRKSHMEAGLLIVGSGTLEGVLREEAAQLPYAEHIMISGDLNHPATLHAIQRSDLMLRTTWYDGDAISIREALHLGVPVVATDNGMRPEGVRMVPPRNLEPLVAAIEEMLANSKRSKSFVILSNENLEEVLGLYKQISSEKTGKASS